MYVVLRIHPFEKTTIPIRLFHYKDDAIRYAKTYPCGKHYDYEVWSEGYRDELDLVYNSLIDDEEW